MSSVDCLDRFGETVCEQRVNFEVLKGFVWTNPVKSETCHFAVIRWPVPFSWLQQAVP